MSSAGKGDFPFQTSIKISSGLRPNINWGNKDPSIYAALDNFFFGTSALKRWDGSDWVLSRLKVYNGTSFNKAKLKMWNGTDWIFVTTV